MHDVSDYLKAQADVFLKKEADWTEKKVHEKRVSTRRLRMALWWLEKASKKEGKPFRKARRALGKLGKALGERRQWDVLVRDAKKYGISTDSIEKDREKAGKAIPAYFEAHGEQIEKRLQKALKRASSAPSLKTARPLQRLQEGLKQWLDHPPQSKEEFHQARIALKKARYVMESLGLDVRAVKDVQDSLGEAHDLEVLQEILGGNQKAAAAEAKARGEAAEALSLTLANAIKALAAI